MPPPRGVGGVASDSGLRGAASDSAAGAECLREIHVLSRAAGAQASTAAWLLRMRCSALCKFALWRAPDRSVESRNAESCRNESAKNEVNSEPLNGASTARQRQTDSVSGATSFALNALSNIIRMLTSQSDGTVALYVGHDL